MLSSSFFKQLIDKDFPEVEKYFLQATDLEIQQLLAELHPADISDLTEDLDEKARNRIFELLDNETAADVLAEIDPHLRSPIVESIDDDKLVKIFDEMDSDDAADIIEELPQEEAEEILESIEPSESKELRKLLEYPNDSAGGIMQTELISLNKNLSIGEAIAEIHHQGKEAGNIHNIYAVDDNHVLLGAIPLNELLLNPPDTILNDIMEEHAFSIPVMMDQEEVALQFQKYDYVALPVVDTRGTLLGRILIDDIVDVIREEASEDIYRLAGVNKDEHAADSALRASRLRLPWLFLYLFTAIFSSWVILSFEEILQKVIILSAFMPIVAGLGGNAGTQSLTVITRSLALGDIPFKDAWKILFKEIVSSLITGTTLGICTGGVVYLFTQNAWLGFVLGLAMISNVFIAAFAGTSVPLILRKFKIDPALASGVFVHTFTDTMGFLVFLGLAKLFIEKLVP